MSEWAYIWRDTYWTEAERSGGYVTTIRYQPVWKPDLRTEVPFPDQDGIDALGKGGWELVTITTAQVSLPTCSSPQQGETYSLFTVNRLFFKRRLT